MPALNWTKCFVACSALCGAVWWCAHAAAGEPVEAFLEALRQRGWYDEAIDYLEQCRGNPLVSEEFKRQLPYHQAVVLLEAAQQTADPAVKQRKLNEVESRLAEFVDSNPPADLAASARRQLASVLAERAQANIARADNSGSDAQRDSLLQESRQLIDRGRELLKTCESFYIEQLEQIPKILDARTEGDTIARRRRLRSELVSARLQIALLIHEKGKTYPPDSDEYRDGLTEAAARFEQLYSKYRRWLAGLYGRLWQGRCYQQLGKIEKAIGCYEDLLMQPGQEPAVRKLATKAAWYQMECLLHQEKVDQVIAGGTSRLEQVRGMEARHPDWLGLKYQVAQAHFLKASAPRSRPAEKKRHLQQARALAREVSRYPNTLQAEAKDLLLAMGAPANPKDWDTFDAAVQAGEAALDVMSSARMGMRLAAENNPDAVAELQQQFEENRKRAFRAFQRALLLADADSPIEKLNRARSSLAYLCWDRGQYYDAAVLGDYVATRYPESAGARQCALIALASYQKLLGSSPDKTTGTLLQRLESLADVIIERWPDGQEAAEAMRLRVGLAIQQGDFDKARGQLQRLSPQRRAGAQRKLGRAVWSQYLRASSGQPSRSGMANEMLRMRSEARTLLQQGLEAIGQRDAVDASVASAALSLAQLHLDAGRSRHAVAVLEHPVYGPLALLEDKSPAASREGYANEVYKAALRAYVGTMPPNRTKVLTTMKALERLREEPAADRPRAPLSRIYLGVAQQLAERIEEAPKASDAAAQQQTIETFEAVLERASRRAGAQDWSSRYWMAQSYVTLADRLNRNDDVSPQADVFYDRAAEIFADMKTAADRDPNYAPDANALLGVMVRRAECLRDLGRFREALDLLADVLGQKPNLLEVQRAAAYTYQQRGEQEDPKWYRRAWTGGRQDKENGKYRIWGWAKLAKIAARYSKYRDVFHEARYNLALSRFRYAKSRDGDLRKEELLRAKNAIRFTVELYPEMGGDPWRSKYDQLLKDIQTELGQSPIGLNEFQRASTAREKKAIPGRSS